MASSVVPTQSSDFYAYLITKVETLALNKLSTVLLKVSHLVASYTVSFIRMFYKSFYVEYTLGSPLKESVWGVRHFLCPICQSYCPL